MRPEDQKNHQSRRESFPKPPKQERKLPEFIIIDDDIKVETEAEYQGGQQQKAGTETGHVSGRVRFFCLLGSFVTLCWTAATLVATLIMLFLVLVSFNKFDPFRKGLKVYYSWFCGATVLTLGLFVATFSFPLGMVIILFYFSEQKEGWQKNIVSRLVKPHAKDYWQS